MSADCITLDQIESRAATSLALAAYVRRVRDCFIAVSLAWPLLSVLNARLGQLTKALRSGSLDKLPDEDLKEIASLLKQLNSALVRLAQDAELGSHKSLRGALESLQDSADDFESIIENIYLALDPGFHRAVDSAVDALQLRVEKRVPVLR